MIHHQIESESRSARWLPAAVLVALLVGGCGSVPFEAPKSASHAFAETDTTSLGRKVAALSAAGGENESGLVLLVDGIEALAARLLLIRTAERSLDVQYYLLLDSLSGRLFVGELLAAADRGVRVRLLLDDISTSGHEFWMSALDSHENIEIRLFNPFSRRKVRVFDFVGRLGRVQHRMHNKSFTADNQVTIVGGRNIGDEYFGAREDLAFIDLDLLGLGPVAQQTAAGFDAYWNSYAAVPVSALIRKPPDPAVVERVRQGHAEVIDKAQKTPYEAALQSHLIAGLGTEVPLQWSAAVVVQDPPEKALKGDLKPKDKELLGARLVEAMDMAESEFVLISPYFVPLKAGLERLSALKERGVRVIVVTNSLAATDVAIVHSGYKKFRQRLLKAGIELWETRADLALESSPVSHQQTSLHTKAFVVDRKFLFVGSFNWDARAAIYNTEMGIFSDSEFLAQRTAETLLEGLPEFAYQVRRGPDGRLEWVTSRAGREQVLGREPDAGFWRRFTVALFGLLPISGQL